MKRFLELCKDYQAGYTDDPVHCEAKVTLLSIIMNEELGELSLEQVEELQAKTIGFLHRLNIRQTRLLGERLSR